MNHIRILLLYITVWYLAGCAAIIDREPRKCAGQAYTVAAMQACNAQYGHTEPTLTDIIAQPLNEAERAYREATRENRTQ